MGPLLYVDTEAEADYEKAKQVLEKQDDKFTRLLKKGKNLLPLLEAPGSCKQSYDCGVYIALLFNVFLMSIWEMTLDKALEYLKKQKFVGKPTAIFNKLLIFKVGAGTVGPAYKNGIPGGMLGQSSGTHRERPLNSCHHQVVKYATP
jgi:hypothetical protein